MNPLLKKYSFIFLLLFVFNISSFCQDTLKAKQIDAIADIKRKGFLGWRDIVGDTITFYQYDTKTKQFYGIGEYSHLTKTRTTISYSFFDGELKRVWVCHCWRVKKANRTWAVYYFDKNQLIHKEEHGMLANNVDYFLTRGNNFLKKAPQRFLEPEFQ